jgi:hypothetical protein
VPEKAKRRRSLWTIAKQLREAGLLGQIERIERWPDGTEVLVFRKPGDDGAAGNPNPWDRVLVLEDAKKKRAS